VDAATVVWIARADAERASLPGEDERALEEWGRARGMRLSAPDSAVTPTIQVDLTVGDRVEDDLERARDASSALDADLTERYLARAEALVRAHPELPESAWLMAEVLRGWSIRWGRVPPREPERAAAAWRRARGLDGGRQAGLGEEATTTTDPDVPFALSLDGMGEARIDGARVAPGPLRATVGEHQLTVTRERHLVWAGWVDLTEGAAVRVALPSPPPCSGEELSKVTIEGHAVRADGVRCEHWVAARPGPHGGSVQVATCRVDRCGALLEWSVGGAVPWVADARPHPGFHWPAWATWTLVGVGAAAITGTTLALTGVFRESSTESPFMFGDLRVMSSRGPARK
jgi:hypothetical protein